VGARPTGVHQQTFYAWSSIPSGGLERRDMGFQDVYRITVSIAYDSERIVTIGSRNAIDLFHGQAPFIEEANLCLC